MIKRSFLMFNLPDMNDLPYMERWFIRSHGPEVMARAAGHQYVAYRVVPAPPGAENYGYYNYR